MKTPISTCLLALTLAACGGESISDPAAASGGSGGASGSAGSGGAVSPGGSGGAVSPGGSGGGGSGGSGGGGSGGSSGASGSAGSASCVPEPGPNPMEYTCETLSVLTVSDPFVEDDNGDGALSAGEGGTLHVRLNEVAGVGFGMYPGVSFESDAPGVSVQEDDWYYAISPCDSYDAAATLEVSPGVSPGTVVTITARVAMVNTECPNAYAIEIPLTIDEPIACSTALRSSASPGSVFGEKRATTWPFLSITNFAKFHWMSPGPSGAVSCDVSQS